jgi:hypothetical protein
VVGSDQRWHEPRVHRDLLRSQRCQPRLDQLMWLGRRLLSQVRRPTYAMETESVEGWLTATLVDGPVCERRYVLDEDAIARHDGLRPGVRACDLVAGDRIEPFAVQANHDELAVVLE